MRKLNYFRDKKCYDDSDGRFRTVPLSQMTLNLTEKYKESDECFKIN